MTRSYSTYLNLLRILAALAVFLSHAAARSFTNGTVWAPERMGHKAVILFFVLSGYVIAYVAREREHTLASFAVSRAARIYSVALPALAVSFAVQLLLWHLGSRVPVYQLTQPLKYLAVFTTFMGDSWFLREDAFANVPYWSLFYEVWYYAGFAAVFYLRGWIRVVALVAVALLTGPRIWLLAPLWLLGCLVYRLHGRAGPGRLPARLLFAASLAAAWFVLVIDPNSAINAWADRLSGGWMGAHLRYSQYVLGDLLTGGVVAVNLYAARYADLRFGWAARPIAWGASFTFALYLLHYPLLQFYAALHLPVPALIAAVLGSALLLGQVTERQKDGLRAWMMAALSVPAIGRIQARLPHSR
ncbi:MAG TPA: acyltransferase [Acetobacteraceae bacterium]|nr:acyltransferase [Acetobacteraceae bacterium]